jgi:putative transposase
MKTVEFKLSLNQFQRAKVDSWLNVQRWVWNHGLRLLEQFDAFNAWDKIAKQWMPCCPLPWEYYKNDSRQLVPFSRLARVKPYRMSCPIPQSYHKPELDSPTFFGLGYYFAQKNHSDKPWFCDVPNKFVFGTLKSLADAWQQYKSGKRKRPRYKGYRHKVKTLVNNSAKCIKVRGRKITLPKLGQVSVKTIDKRWLESIPISTLKIIKEPSGYYLQLTGEMPTKALKPSDKAVGIVMGYHAIYTTDEGKVVEPPGYYRQMEKRLARLQRKANRRQQGSANQQKVFKQIGRLHEKIRRARRAFNHKLSTYLVQEYGGIATTTAQIKKIIRRPSPVVNKEGTGYEPNGATRKAQVNKQFLDNGLTQLTTMVEQKAQVHEREFIKVNSKDLPEELRQRAKKYSKKLRLPRAVYLSTFCKGRYRDWDWVPQKTAKVRSKSKTKINKEALVDSG